MELDEYIEELKPKNVKLKKKILQQISIENAISFEMTLDIANGIIQPFNVYNYPDFNILVIFLESKIKCNNSFGFGF